MSGDKLFISLACPSCGGELNGGENARIHVCFACGKAYVMDEFPRNLPLLVFKPRIAPGSKVFYVPFFRIEGSFSFDVGDVHKARAWSNMKPLRMIHYPAFPNLRSLYSEDLTIRYALDLGDVEPEEKKEKVSMVDGTRNPVHLETIGRLVWLSYFDRVADVTGADAEFTVSRVSYSLVPFERTDDGLRELMLGNVLRGFVELAPNE